MSWSRESRQARGYGAAWAKLTSWEKDGEEKHGLSVVADKVLTVYAAGKARKAAQEATEA